jgi:hypothetical protein
MSVEALITRHAVHRLSDSRAGRRKRAIDLLGSSASAKNTYAAIAVVLGGSDNASASLAHWQSAQAPRLRRTLSAVDVSVGADPNSSRLKDRSGHHAVHRTPWPSSATSATASRSWIRDRSWKRERDEICRAPRHPYASCCSQRQFPTRRARSIAVAGAPNGRRPGRRDRELRLERLAEGISVAVGAGRREED